MNKKRLKIVKIDERSLPLLIYAFLSIVVLIPLLKPGYIFTLDSTQVFTNPIGRFFFPDQGAMATSAGIPADVLNFLFARILPPWIFEKIFLFCIFFFAGLGAHRLVDMKGIGSYFVGVFYAINPFTYIRFMAGQWGLLWAYALIPFGINAILELMDMGDIKTAVKLAILTTLVGLLDIRGFFLLILIFAILVIVRLVKDLKNKNTKFQFQQIVKTIAISIGLFFMLNVYWIVPALTAHGTLLNQIGQADLLLFASHASSNLGVIFDVASLWGFWRNGYFVTSNFIPFWWGLFVIILFFAVYGTLFQRSQQRWLVFSFASIGIIGLLLALGAASNLTYHMFDSLWQNVPFFKGFRDSQVFDALLCLAYAVLGGFGINLLIKSWDRWKQRKFLTILLASFSVVVVLVYAFPMLGFHGQLKPTDYPKGWEVVNEYLNEDKTNFNVLFLPWHEYVDFSWLPNRDQDLSNPAQQFFDKPIIAGDNMESGGIYSESTNPISRYVEFLLSNGSNINNLGELLAPLNVKYVILVDEADYQLYNYLYQQKDLKIVLEQPGITLLQNEYPTAQTYAVNSVVHIQSLNDYLKLSQTQDVMEHIYVFGSGTDVGSTEPFSPINTVENSPINYQIGATLQNYTIFTVSQNVSTDNWEFNGQNQIMTNLGFMPVFKASPKKGNIVYSKFYYLFLPCDAISFLALIGMIILFIKKPKIEWF
jgi:hypothetical protein